MASDETALTQGEGGGGGKEAREQVRMRRVLQKENMQASEPVKAKTEKITIKLECESSNSINVRAGEMQREAGM